MRRQIAAWAILLAAIPVTATAQAKRPAPHRAATRAAAPPPAAVQFALAPAGNEARFVVREQLMTFDRPNDAVGRTTHISGGVRVAPDGRIDPSASQIVVDLATLATDKPNRDTWIKSHTLKTDSFPRASLVVKEIEGLPVPLPLSGSFRLKLRGDLEIHGVSRPTTWDLQLTANGGDYSGTATTHVKFEDFGMDQPRLMIVMSVVDDIRLEYDFHLVRQ